MSQKKPKVTEQFFSSLGQKLYKKPPAYAVLCFPLNGIYTLACSLKRKYINKLKNYCILSLFQICRSLQLFWRVKFDHNIHDTKTCNQITSHIYTNTISHRKLKEKIIGFFFEGFCIQVSTQVRICSRLPAANTALQQAQGRYSHTTPFSTSPSCW